MPGPSTPPLLAQWSISLIRGSAALYSGASFQSTQVMREACRAASLTDLAERLDPGDPAFLLEAAHQIAGSEDLQRRISEHLGAEKRLAVQNDAVRLQQMLGTTIPVKIVVLGDVHNKWKRVETILDHEFPWGYGIVLAVGDLETYPTLAGGHHVYFIHGNHEGFDRIAQMRDGTDPLNRNYTPIFAGECIRIGALMVAGLPGVYSPYYYENPAGAPLRYYTPDGITAVRTLKGPVDILLTHEAPRGVGFRKGDEDLGTQLVTEVMRALGPGLAFFGHHHLDFEGRDGETEIVGLDYPTRSCVVLEFDPKSGEIKMTRERAELVAEGRGHYKHYQFRWERDTEGRGPVYERSLALKKEERVLRILKERYEAAVEGMLCQDLLKQVTGTTAAERESQARGRAGLAISTVLPHVARYIARLESDPHLPQEERRRLLREIHDQMTSKLEPFTIPDLQKAIQFFLQAWGLVAD